MDIISSVANFFGGKKEAITGQEEEQEMARKLNSLLQSAAKKHDEVLEYVKDNDKMYLGKHWSSEKRPTYKSDTVLNFTYMAVETVVPIMTDRQPILEAHYVDKRKESVQQSEKVEKALKYHWRRLGMDLVTPVIVRQMLIERDCFVKPCWNIAEDDVDLELINKEYLYIDPDAISQKDIEYVIFSVPHSIKYAKENFPELAKKIEQEFSKAKLDNEDSSKVKINEFWGFVESEGTYDIWVINWIGNTILRKVKNPYWDFSKEEVSLEAPIIPEQTSVQGLARNPETLPPDLLNQGAPVDFNHSSQIAPSMGMGSMINQPQPIKKYNHFKKQQLPLIKFETFNSGKEYYSVTGLIEQTKKIQLSINKRKAQIDENANLMANGQWIVDKDAGVNISLLTNQPGLVVEKMRNTEVRREPGVALPTYVQEDLRHSQQSFDNIFGTHDITRGERTQNKTATEATILKDADQGRIALLIRNFNAGIIELGNWWIHLMKLYYKEPHYVSIFGEKEAGEFIAMTQDDIEDGIELQVKVGSNIPQDRVSRREEWKELGFRGLITPDLLYEKLGEIEDPELEAKRLDLFKKGFLYNPPPPQQPQGQQLPPDLPPSLIPEGEAGLPPALQ